MTSLLPLDVASESLHNLGLKDVTKYSIATKKLYIKHVFIKNLDGDLVKPKLTYTDLEFFGTTNAVDGYCYVLVYVFNKRRKKFDMAFFLEDAEAIKGIDTLEAKKRMTDLYSISRNIRGALLGQF
ncbi:hypothetical protein BGP78_22040 [Pseudoalteromonas sp. MSK9-3]|uniref:hypothetical protein n=1 Tax=Pseudoalteromonas sp. MSK9-3 TaxID=1897633 RepID=UPI000E6CDA66|nr:hypothetical protein [Pseudoalteromonas sp. MSK9-3]RJE71158.1 hypothetical protein BGP78_22040 [Pseudoalteromonas sp. MSK9-3]